MNLIVENGKNLKRFSSVVLIGGSGSGKTTIVSGLRRYLQQENFAFPTRVISRERRSDDSADDNISIGVEEFSRCIERDELVLYWTKVINGKNEYYGFKEKNLSRTPVYSCNDALLLNVGALTKPSQLVLAEAYVVQVVCPREDRARRLLRRSPELLHKERELDVRLQDHDKQLWPMVNVRVLNLEARNEEAVFELGDHLVQKRNRGEFARSAL